MIRRILLLSALAVTFLAAASPASSIPGRQVNCGGGDQCGGGSGFPPCNASTVGTSYYPPGHRWICLANPYQWIPVY